MLLLPREQQLLILVFSKLWWSSTFVRKTAFCLHPNWLFCMFLWRTRGYSWLLLMTFSSLLLSFVSREAFVVPEALAFSFRVPSFMLEYHSKFSFYILK